MLSGSLNSENLAQTLRDISQRRRQGVLQVEFSEQKLEILIVQGRVVDVVDLACSPVSEVLTQLQRSGLADSEIQYEPGLLTYASLFELLQKSATPVDQQSFKQVLLHRVLERLYDLDSRTGGFFIFQMRMVEYEREYAPSVSVGQLLLDLVALKNDRPKFQQLFHKGVRLEQIEGAGASLSSEESYVWNLIQNGIDFETLKRRCYLSSYHLQDALLSFASKNLLSLSQVQRKAEGLNLDSIADAFDQQIDSVFDGATPAAALGSAPGSVLLDQMVGEQLPRASFSQRVKTRINLWNLKLLHASWIPGAISFVFLLAAALAPFFLWGEVLRDF